jgi:anthraniloyl-CoA monooxygenase
MFTPFRLRELVLPHRVVAAPVALEAAEAGCAGDGHLVHLGARAQGAAALVYCERTSVAPAPGRGLALYTDEQVVALRRVAGFVQSSGSALAVPLWAEGSALAQWGDVTRLCDAFVRAARRADEAGVDLLELDCSTGLLAAILASARERGGIRDRGRPILEVIGALRRAWPERKPLALRLAPSPAAEVALADDAVTLAGLFRQCGGDLVSVASAQPTPERLATAPLADRIRNECVVPTLCEGGIASCADINSLLAAGRADLCGLGRATLFDPAFARHAAASQRVDLPLVGHLGALATYRPRLSLD